MELIVRSGDEEETLHLERTAEGWSVRRGDKTYPIDQVLAGGRRSLRVEGRQYEVTGEDLGESRYRISSRFGTSTVEVMDPLTKLAREAGDGAGGSGQRQVTAYMPGRVVKILVAVGDNVEAGAGVLVLEAMKMENEIQAELAGRIRSLSVVEGATVEAGAVLFELEPEE